VCVCVCVGACTMHTNAPVPACRLAHLPGPACVDYIVLKYTCA